MGIYVWGTGCGAAELVEKGLEPQRITAFVDSFPTGDTFSGRPVLTPEALTVSQGDIVLVTTRQSEAVARKCAELRIPGEALLFLKNSQFLCDRNAGCTAAEEILGAELLDKLLPRQQVVSVPAQLAGSKLPGEDSDYVRLATLELLCRQLASVPGACGELGVYQGFFARCINSLLPERTLYLFDSFQGFAPDAGAGEAFQEAHEKTSVSRVLAALPHPEKAVVKPGFFPESLQGLEETFCLVSLDADFEEVTLEGLRYFWPRLSQGGYLLLHDWGNPALPGVARALERYRQECGSPVPAVPLPDRNGTLVLCK